MIVLADSGSTKTDWQLIKGKDVVRVLNSEGMNPYFISTTEAAAILHKTFADLPEKDETEAVFFYGAGCSSPSKQDIINKALQEVFPGSHTEVEHDMLAAARALFANKPGIPCILGTGSNSCVYDGKQITDSLFSLGYMFGDEGSGAHLGKTYIADHFKKRAPQEIREAFTTTYGLSDEDILTNIYNNPNPNRFLASFAPFIREHLEHPYINRLAENCFDGFFREQVTQYDDYQKYPMGCIGSVGYHFRHIIENSARKFGVQAETFMISPMEGLISYHAG